MMHFYVIKMRRKRQHGMRNVERVDKNYCMNLTLQGKEKGTNEVVKRVTATKLRLLLADH